MELRPIGPGSSVSSPAAETPSELAAQSVLLTYDGWLVGELVDADGRVSDALSRRNAIRVMTRDGYREIDRDEVLALVPPPTVLRAEVRIAKRRVPVTIDLAGFVSVRGYCHLMPGATIWDAWQLSTSGFAPLTEAEVEFPDGTTETADVVLISRHAAASGLRTA